MRGVAAQAWSYAREDAILDANVYEFGPLGKPRVANDEVHRHLVRRLSSTSTASDVP